MLHISESVKTRKPAVKMVHFLDNGSSLIWPMDIITDADRELTILAALRPHKINRS